MNSLLVRSFAAVTALSAAGSATAAINWSPNSVPVDSPWAIAGLGAVIAVVAARMLVNRRK